MIVWKQVPWTLWAYSAVLLLATISIEVKVHGPDLAKVLFVAVMLAWLFFLFKGVRWVWMGTIGIYVLGFVLDLISSSFTWQGVALSLIGITLLLLPITQRYFSRRTAGAGA